MNLRPYQEVGRDFLATHRHALLADEMRVGKTPQAILAAQQVGAEDILVVCPAIAVEHWRREFRKWWFKSPMPRDLRICSYDKAKLHKDELLSTGWDLTIVDEAHFAKNPTAARTQLVFGKGGLGWVSERMWALSGTPAPKHAGELWPMLKAFGVVGMTYSEFTHRYCTFDWTGTKITGTKEKYIPELQQRLATIMLRRKRKDVAPEMPDIDFQFLEIEPVSRVDLNARLGRFHADESLLQYLESSPAAYKEDRIAVAKAKALPLVDNIEFALKNDLLRQTVVFGWHTEPLFDVARALNARGFSAHVLTGATLPGARTVIQDNFRDGRVQVIVANILAAGTAIDLSAASHGYFLELDWVPGNNLQAANRLISMLKKEKVTFDIATWPGSADDRVQRVLLRRAKELGKLY